LAEGGRQGEGVPGAHRAARFDRRVPSELPVTGLAFGQRLASREPPERGTRKVAGETLRTGDHATRAARSLVDPSPNAPLLMRLVLHPFAISTTRGARAACRAPVPWGDLKVVRLVGASVLARDDRRREPPGGPLRSMDDRRFSRRAVPSVDAWLAHRDRAAGPRSDGVVRG
jgi:hypothetical protein